METILIQSLHIEAAKMDMMAVNLQK